MWPPLECLCTLIQTLLGWILIIPIALLATILIALAWTLKCLIKTIWAIIHDTIGCVVLILLSPLLALGCCVFGSRSYNYKGLLQGLVNSEPEYNDSRTLSILRSLNAEKPGGKGVGIGKSRSWRLSELDHAREEDKFDRIVRPAWEKAIETLGFRKVKPDLIRPQPQSKLLSLPWQLRAQIYRYALDAQMQGMGIFIFRRSDNRLGSRWFTMPITGVSDGDFTPWYFPSTETGALDAECQISTHGSGRNMVGLLRTCRLVYNETHHILYQNNLFAFRDHLTLHYLAQTTLPLQLNRIAKVQILLPFHTMQGSWKSYDTHIAWVRKCLPFVKEIQILLQRNWVVDFLPIFAANALSQVDRLSDGCRVVTVLYGAFGFDKRSLGD